MLLVVSCVMKALLGMGVSAAGNGVLWVALVCLSFPLNQKFVCFFLVKVTGLGEGFHILDLRMLGNALQLPCPTYFLSNLTLFSSFFAQWNEIENQLCSMTFMIFF